MRVFILLLCVFALGIGVGVGLKLLPSSGEGGMHSDSKSTEREIAYWVAPMDPNFRSDEPGQSPMGMDLVPVYEDELSGGASAPEGAIKIDPIYTHTLGVKTDEVAQQEFGRHIRAFGKIASSTRLEHAVDVRTKGWIVDLAVGAVGDAVQKGDLLFTYYSPDLMTAQADFMIGRRIGGAKQRLRLFGMDDKAIEVLRKKGRFLEKTPFHAPVDGTVTLLSVRKGAHVSEGGNVMMIQDFSRLWVNVYVPIRDAQFLRVGTLTKVTLPETGETYETSIDFIHPVNDPQSRTVMVRLILENPDGILKPDTYIDALFKADVQSRLAVPVEAVLYSSMGAYVMEDAGEGYFRPVMVTTGITANGLTEIKSGLKSGQHIVTSGQFMLDAESNLRGGMAAMGHDHGDMKDGTQEEGAAHGQH